MQSTVNQVTLCDLACVCVVCALIIEVLLNVLVRKQELPPRYTRRFHQILVSQRKLHPSASLHVPRLVGSLKRTCLKQQPWVHSEKKAPCEHRCSWPSRASSLPFNRAAVDKFTSPRLTRGLTFQTWYWQENSRRREGWREARRKREMRKIAKRRKRSKTCICWQKKGKGKESII